MADYRNKCGSCLYWERDKNTKHGWCKKRKYEPDVACDPEHPFPVYSASHAKCQRYLYMPNGQRHEKTGGAKMTTDRAIEILTLDHSPDYSPSEYEEALAMARDALKAAQDES